jgi:hypothetical protein
MAHAPLQSASNAQRASASPAMMRAFALGLARVLHERVRDDAVGLGGEAQRVVVGRVARVEWHRRQQVQLAPLRAARKLPRGNFRAETSARKLGTFYRSDRLASGHRAVETPVFLCASAAFRLEASVSLGRAPCSQMRGRPRTRTRT